MEKTKFCTIIITHFAMNDERSETMRESLNSLWNNTHYPYELIVVDNGNSKEDSEFLMDATRDGLIHTYVRNARNMHFAYARNQAFALSHGQFICIADNDIRYHDGWLTECVEVLESDPDRKMYATPMPYPMIGLNERYHQGWYHFKGKKYELNMRAGSNCFVIRREHYEEIGGFPAHRIGGSKWTDLAVKAGYLACVLPTVYAEDMGLRKGYDLKKFIPINIKLQNGPEIHFNEDEFRKHNPKVEYYA